MLIRIYSKLERITGDFVIAGSYGVRNLTLPALETITGGVYLDGHFDEYVYRKKKICQHTNVVR